MFYDNYVKLCEGKGEKPTPVAQKLGCSSSNVALWKKGSVPRSATLNKIADYFGVTPQFLLFGETDDQSIKKDLPKEVELTELQKEAWKAILRMDNDELRAIIMLSKRHDGE